MPLERVWRRVESVRNPSVGILLEIVLDVVGLDDAPHFKVIPVAVIERPLNLPAFRQFVDQRPPPPAPVPSIPPPAPQTVPLSYLASLIGRFLQQESDLLEDIKNVLAVLP